MDRPPIGETDAGIYPKATPTGTRKDGPYRITRSSPDVMSKCGSAPEVMPWMAPTVSVRITLGAVSTDTAVTNGTGASNRPVSTVAVDARGPGGGR